jgi:hypothetical protein
MRKSGKFFGAMMLLAASAVGKATGFPTKLRGAMPKGMRISHTSRRVGPVGKMRRKPWELPYTKHFGTFSPLKPLAHLREE